MDLSSIAGSFGESVLNILAERLTINSASVKSACLRPREDPMSAKIDVTKGFSALVSKQLMLTDQKLSPRDLVIAGAPHGGHRAFWMGPRAPAVPAVAGSWWLCVVFSVPGGVTYTACYAIPEEAVTFPPVMSSTLRTIMPLNRQVVHSAVIAAVEGGDRSSLPSSSSSSSSPSATGTATSSSSESGSEDEDGGRRSGNRSLMDITRQMRAMVGPDGTSFGRGWVDIRLALADSLDDIADAARRGECLSKMVSSMVCSPRVSVVVDTADGERTSAVGYRWTCPQSCKM